MNNITLEESFLTAVKNNYYELYLCSLLTNKYTSQLLILISIFIEITSIPSKISEKMIGYIRLAWWREALDEITSNPRNHPLILELKKFNNEINIFYLKEIIDSCEIELEEEFDEYNFNQLIQKRYVSLFKLIGNIINPDHYKKDYGDLAISFFIIIEIIIKGRYREYINFLGLNNFQLTQDKLLEKDPTYMKDLIKLSTNYIELFEKNSILYKQDLFIKLLITSLKLYIKQINKNKFNTDNFKLAKYKLKLIIKLCFMKLKTHLPF